MPLKQRAIRALRRRVVLILITIAHNQRHLALCEDIASALTESLTWRRTCTQSVSDVRHSTRKLASDSASTPATICKKTLVENRSCCVGS